MQYFSTMIKTFAYARLRLQSKEAKTSFELYQDLKSLPLNVFIEVSCNENLQALIKSGEPPTEALQTKWEELFTAYIEIIGGEEVQDKLKLVATMNELSFKVERIGALLDVLSVAPTEGLYEQLYTFGYSLPRMDFSEASIKTLGKIITGYMKRDVVEVQILGDRLKKETGEVKKQTEADFYALIVEISDMFKITLNEKETSTMAFAMYVNKYKQRAEQIMRKQQKQI
jgi:hypothetical protein